jgi:hypothetical protein
VPGANGPAWRHVYAITPEFARASGWRFPVNSIVILNVGGGGMFRYWQGVLGAAGASSLLSWSGPVTVKRLLAFAEDFIHLTLATNSLEGQRYNLRVPPRQRAYGIGETLGFLSDNGLTRDGDGGEAADYLPTAAAERYVNTLVPTIAYAVVKEGSSDTGERGRIELNGLFGANRGGRIAHGEALGRFDEPLLGRAADPPVTGNDQLTMISWKGDYLTADLDERFDCGYLQVVNDGRVSNVVRITRWKIPLTLRTTITGGSGSLVRETTVEIQLRADLRGWRLTFGERSGERNAPTMELVQRPGSTATYAAHGEISGTVERTTTTIDWTGNGTIDPRLPSDVLNFSGTLTWHERVLTAFFHVGGGTIQAHKLVTRDREVVSESTQPVPFVAAAPTSPEQPLQLRFDALWNLGAGEYRSPPRTVHMIADETEETVLSWPAVIADFPPVDDEGT